MVPVGPPPDRRDRWPLPTLAAMTYAAAPAWFRRALAVPYEDHHVEVAGCRVHYLAWGESDRPGLVFVHGGAAHAHWWTHIAPQFADDYRVAALDLSGHGDSGRREQYSLETWTQEIMAVAADAGVAGPPIVVGHSMGGFVSIATAAEFGNAVAGIVIFDSPVIREDAEVEAARLGTSFKPPRVYPDVDTALSRFRTVPEQDHYEPYVLDYIARRSLGPVEGGWSWKFDSRIFRPWRNEVADYLPRITCRIALFRSELGLATEEVGEYLYENTGRVAPVILVPEAGHHLMLDQPLLLTVGLRTLLADWEHSVPFRRAPDGAA